MLVSWTILYCIDPTVMPLFAGGHPGEDHVYWETPTAMLLLFAVRPYYVDDHVYWETPRPCPLFAVRPHDFWDRIQLLLSILRLFSHCSWPISSTSNRLNKTTFELKLVFSCMAYICITSSPNFIRMWSGGYQGWSCPGVINKIKYLLTWSDMWNRGLENC